MSGHNSNLSESKYDYDLVVATTQDSINATMKEFLSQLDEQDFNACYQWDDDGNCVPIDYQKVTSAISGDDPFTIPNKANKDARVKKLDDLGFAFAFRASFGISTGVPINQIPDIITLDRGNQFVTYRMFCTTFDIIVLDEAHHQTFWTNISQPDDNPWVFKFNVDLDLRTNNDYFGKLPKSVQQKINNLSPDSMFSVQQLYLDLNTAGLQDEPDIEGLNKSSPAYEPLKRAFIDTYWTNAKKKGDPLLGYTLKPVTPNPNTAQPSIIPTDLNIEVSPNLDAQGNATKTYGLYTLDYLVMSEHRPLPAPVQFDWNWIDESEQSDYHGVAAIRRAIFVNFLRDLVNEDVAILSIDPTVELTHSGDDYSISYSYKRSTSPASFASVTPPTTDNDGFTTMLNIAYNHPSRDDSEAGGHLSSIHGDFNYTLSGEVAFKGDVIRLKLHGVAYIQFNTHEAGVTYDHLDGNYFDMASTVTYTLGVDAEGQLVVTQSTPQIVDSSADFSWNKGGILDLFNQMDSLRDSLNNINTSIGDRVKNAFKDYESDITSLINNSHAWVFPGGKTFAYKAVYFSDAQDLITHVTYVDPT